MRATLLALLFLFGLAGAAAAQDAADDSRTRRLPQRGRILLFARAPIPQRAR